MSCQLSYQRVVASTYGYSYHIVINNNGWQEVFVNNVAIGKDFLHQRINVNEQDQR